MDGQETIFTMFWWPKPLCLKIPFVCTHSVNVNIQTTDGQCTVWHLSSCVALMICAVFFGLVKTWACPGLGISILHYLPLWNIWEAIHYCCLWHTCSTVNSINLWILTGCHCSALRNWITIWYTIFKLHCNFFHTSCSYLPSHLYCSTQASTSAFTESNTQLCCLHSTAEPQTGIGWTCLITTNYLQTPLRADIQYDLSQHTYQDNT
jgi:hypothetical protein